MIQCTYILAARIYIYIYIYIYNIYIYIYIYICIYVCMYTGGRREVYCFRL